MPLEILDVVDKDDNVIGKAPRKDVHGRGLWHRGVHVLLFNSEGKVLLQMRGPDRDLYPNTYDLAVSEHNKSGEAYEEALRRGLREELGIESAKSEKLVKFRMNYGSPHDNMIGVIYRIFYNRRIIFDEKEITSIRFFTERELKGMIEKVPNKFSSWALEILKWYFGMPSMLEEIG
jgi:isopentenyldiphosphate isomerase